LRILAVALVMSLLAGGVGGAAPAPAPPMEKVVLATVRSITNLPVDIAIARGYFKEQGVDLETKFFGSGVDIVPALGTNQVDIGEGSVTPALINAMARGIDLKVVGQKAACAKSFDFCPVVVRKDLYDSGQLRTWNQMRGRTIAISNLYTGSHYKLVLLDKEFGISASDYRITTLPFANMAAALQNRAIDAAVVIEPIATQIEGSGFGVRLLDGRHSPNVLVTLISYSQKFRESRALVGRRYMNAYMKGARDLIRARLALEKKNEKLWEAIRVDPWIQQEYPQLKDKALADKASVAYVDPDARVNEKALAEIIDWYRAAGRLEGRQLGMREVVDQSFADYSFRMLGKFKE
jgi:NitT/TauT family transport system substrate-binding protein